MKMAKIRNLCEQYLATVEFEEVIPEQVTRERLTDMPMGTGLVVSREDSVQLWVSRKLQVMHFMNVPTVMENMLGQYEIRDDFGFLIWKGNTEETLQYVEGYFEVGISTGE